MNVKNVSTAITRMIEELSIARQALNTRDLATCSAALQYVEMTAEPTYLAFIEYRDQYERGEGDV